MTHYRFLVESRPHAGQEQAYHEWYDSRHGTDLLALPGARCVQRFNRVALDGSEPSFFMIVDYETDDLAGLLATIKARAQGPDMPSSNALDRGSVRVTILEARSPPRDR